MSELALRPPTAARRLADRLTDKKSDREKLLDDHRRKLVDLHAYLEIAGKVTAALELLSEKLFEELLGKVQDKLSIALQEVLDQPLRLRADASFSRKAASVSFWIERDGNKEDILRGQGGSVANVLSVGLRLFALKTVDAKKHRPFLVLDEQDCWLRPDLVPKLVQIIHDAGKSMGLQVLMISHHDASAFDRFADRIYQFTPTRDGVEVREIRRVKEAMDEAASAWRLEG